MHSVACRASSTDVKQRLDAHMASLGYPFVSDAIRHKRVKLSYLGCRWADQGGGDF